MCRLSDGWSWFTDHATIIATVVSAIAAGFIAFFTVTLAGATEKMRVTSQKQAEITQRQSIILEKQTEISASENRPFVFVKEIVLRLERGPSKVGTFAAQIIEGPITGWNIAPVWTNSGNTAPIRLLVQFNHQSFPSGIPANFAFPDPDGPPQPAFVGPGATVQTAGYRLAGNDMSRIAAGMWRELFWGWCEYSDRFDPLARHRTEYCFEVRIIGDPQIQGEVSISFQLHDRFNGADSGCLRSSTT